MLHPKPGKIPVHHLFSISAFFCSVLSTVRVFKFQIDGNSFWWKKNLNSLFSKWERGSQSSQVDGFRLRKKFKFNYIFSGVLSCERLSVPDWYIHGVQIWLWWKLIQDRQFLISFLCFFVFHKVFNISEKKSINKSIFRELPLLRKDWGFHNWSRTKKQLFFPLLMFSSLTHYLSLLSRSAVRNEPNYKI